MKRSSCRSLMALSQVKPMSLLQLKAEDIERVKKWVEGPSPLKRAQGFMKSAFQQVVEGRPDPAAKLVISAAVLAGFGYKENPELASRIIETARRVVHHALTAKTGAGAAAVAGLTDLFSPYQLDSKGTMWALLGGISPEARAFIARKIPILVHEGMPQRQAVATAYAMARRRFPSVPAAPMGFLSMLGGSPESMVEKIRQYARFITADLKEPGHREAAKEWLEHISKLARRARRDLSSLWY